LEAFSVLKKSFSHPAHGVRKAAVEVLPSNQLAAEVIQMNNLLKDANLGVRKSVLLAIAALPPSNELGKLVQEASKNPENEKDEWLAKALFAAAISHREGFLASSSVIDQSINNEQLNFSDRLAKLVSQEIYVIDRRNPIVSSPDVKGKEIFIKSSIITRAESLQGVIVAQGGKSDGYGLYVKDGKLNFTVNMGGKSYTATTTDPLPEKFDVLASMTQNGEINIELGGKIVANAKAPSLFTKSLIQELRISKDLEGDDKIGNYEEPTRGGVFALRGDMQNSSIELKTPSKLEVKAETITNNTALKPIVINIKVIPDMMQFDKKLINVKAGQKVTIDFENPDGMQHNFLIIKPKSLEKVGAAADAMLRDPKAADKNYTPSIPEVLQSIKLLNPEESFQLTFTAPTEPGDYPFVCTFPGHWRGMNGIMRVTK
jgi:azurin